jgi:ADP-heptose:LPS heptosyltransferase
MREKNLYRLRRALRYKGPWPRIKEKLLYIGQEDKNYINALLQDKGITGENKIIIVSPAAGGYTRRWEKEKFIQLCQRLVRNYSVILIGRENDKALTGEIKANCKAKIFDFAGLTNLAQLASLLKRSSLVVVCDTGTLQLASYLDVPVVAMFGPSDEQRYGPWSSRFKVVTASVSCRPCKSPECRFNTIECMKKIEVSEVLDSIDALLKL